MFAAILHHIFLIVNNYNKLHKQFDYQQAVLITKHYLTSDIRSSSNIIRTCPAIIGGCTVQVPTSIEHYINKQDIKPGSNILILSEVIYYLRRSISPANNHLQSFTLYRDDLEHNAIAIADGVTDMQVTIEEPAANIKAVLITLRFKNLQNLELICVPRMHKTV